MSNKREILMTFRVSEAEKAFLESAYEKAASQGMAVTSVSDYVRKLSLGTYKGEPALTDRILELESRLKELEERNGNNS